MPDLDLWGLEMNISEYELYKTSNPRFGVEHGSDIRLHAAWYLRLSKIDCQEVKKWQWRNPKPNQVGSAGVGKCPNVSHHPTIGDIISNRYLFWWCETNPQKGTHICFGDVKHKIPKKGHLPTPVLVSLWNPDIFGTTRGAQNGDGFIDCSDSRVLRIDLAANSRWIKGGLRVPPVGHNGRYWKILCSTLTWGELH